MSLSDLHRCTHTHMKLYTCVHVKSLQHRIVYIFPLEKWSPGGEFFPVSHLETILKSFTFLTLEQLGPFVCHHSGEIESVELETTGPALYSLSLAVRAPVTHFERNKSNCIVLIFIIEKSRSPEGVRHFLHLTSL